MRTGLALLAIASICNGQQVVWDLLLKNGHVIDPANRRDGRFDVAIAGGRIARVAADLPAAHARRVVEASVWSKRANTT
jgi:dihydroorotase